MLAVDCLNPFRTNRPMRWEGNCVISSIGGLGDLIIQLPLIAGLVAQVKAKGQSPIVALRPAHVEIGIRAGWEVMPFENPLQYVFNRQLSLSVLRKGMDQTRELRRRQFATWLDLTGNAANALGLKAAGIPFLASKITRGGRSLVSHRLPHEPNENEYSYRERLADHPELHFLDFDVYGRVFDKSTVDKRHVALCVTTGCRWRNWPLANFEKLVTELPESKFVLIGSKREISEDDLPAYQRLVANPCVNDCLDKQDVMQLIESVASAVAVVTDDSAGAHIANGWHVPGAVLFGPALSETWADPNGLRVFHDRSCPFHPCRQWDCDNPSSWCMHKISPIDVSVHIASLISMSETSDDSVEPH